MAKKALIGVQQWKIDEGRMADTRQPAVVLGLPGWQHTKMLRLCLSTMERVTFCRECSLWCFLDRVTIIFLRMSDEG
jgi:hypothetical protein